jgi:hypothetical protein
MQIKVNVLVLFPLALPAIPQAPKAGSPTPSSAPQPTRPPTPVPLSIAIGTSCLFWDAAETSSQVLWRWPVGHCLGNRFS